MGNSEMREILQKREDSQEELDTVLHNELRSRGWKYTCANPGSLWMWEKKLHDGRTCLVIDANVAADIQAAIEDNYAPTPER